MILGSHCPKLPLRYRRAWPAWKTSSYDSETVSVLEYKIQGLLYKIWLWDYRIHSLEPASSNDLE